VLSLHCALDVLLLIRIVFFIMLQAVKEKNVPYKVCLFHSTVLSLPLPSLI